MKNFIDLIEQLFILGVLWKFACIFGLVKVRKSRHHVSYYKIIRNFVRFNWRLLKKIIKYSKQIIKFIKCRREIANRKESHHIESKQSNVIQLNSYCKLSKPKL